MTKKQETSAGVIPFTVQNGNLEILSVKARTGDWEFPKGGVEGEEQLQQTALREAEEEIGVTDIRIIDSFATEYSYSFYWDGNLVDKTVYLYLGEVFDPTNVTLSDEHNDYVWVEIDDAFEQVTHDGMKNALDDALSHLKSTEKYPFTT